MLLLKYHMLFHKYIQFLYPLKILNLGLAISSVLDPLPSKHKPLTLVLSSKMKFKNLFLSEQMHVLF